MIADFTRQTQFLRHFLSGSGRMKRGRLRIFLCHVTNQCRPRQPCDHSCISRSRPNKKPGMIASESDTVHLLSYTI